MEEDEEEVLCYLDRVLEEEELFDYGDGEMDAGAPLHLQFKVRKQLGPGTRADTCTSLREMCGVKRH